VRIYERPEGRKDDGKKEGKKGTSYHYPNNENGTVLINKFLPYCAVPVPYSSHKAEGEKQKYTTPCPIPITP